MQRPTMPRLLTTSALTVTLILTIPALASPARLQTAATGEAVTQAAPERIRVVPARKAIGRTVLDENGAKAGTISHVAIDATTGNVAALLLRTVGEAPPAEGFVVIPWDRQHLAMQESGDLTVKMSAQRLENAPRVSEERLQDLSTPALRDRVAALFAPAGGAPIPAVDPRSQTGQTVPAETQDPQERKLPGEPVQGTASPYTTTWDNAPPEVKASNSESRPVVLVGPETTQLYDGTTGATAGRLRGALVSDTKGAMLGEIDSIMLDVERGRVAYVVLDRSPDQVALSPDAETGKSARTAADLRDGMVALPLTALTVGGRDSGGGLTLSGAASALDQAPTITPGKDGSVSAREVEALHRHFGQSPDSDGTAGPG